MAIVDVEHVGGLDADRPGQVLGVERRLGVAAHERSGERDPLAQHLVGVGQQAHRLDEAGHADDRVPAGLSADVIHDARQGLHVVARLAAGQELVDAPRDRVSREGVGQRIECRCDVNYGIDLPAAQQPMQDPRGHATRRAELAEIAADDVPGDDLAVVADDFVVGCAVARVQVRSDRVLVA